MLVAIANCSYKQQPVRLPPMESLSRKAPIRSPGDASERRITLNPHALAWDDYAKYLDVAPDINRDDIEVRIFGKEHIANARFVGCVQAQFNSLTRSKLLAAALVDDPRFVYLDTKGDEFEERFVIVRLSMWFAKSAS